MTGRVVTRRHTGTDGSKRRISSTAPGISDGSATSRAQRSGASSSRRTQLPIRLFVVSCPAKLSENRIEAMSSGDSASGSSSWISSSALAKSSPRLSDLSATSSRR